MPGEIDADVWRLVVDMGLFVLIWLVQLIIYPSFEHTREDAFQAWHHQYTGLISIFVLPLMLGQSLLYAFLSITTSRWHDVAGLVFLAMIWSSTFLLSVPCHRRLHVEGYELGTIRRLVRTNWIRTAAWTAMLLIDGLMLPSATLSSS